jgi:small neutral amino acid transporter SnatA (MarC family)
MEERNIIVIIISITGGTFAILASIFNWNFFFENRKVELFIRLLGRTGSRIFYTLLGLVLLYLAYKMIKD